MSNSSLETLGSEKEPFLDVASRSSSDDTMIENVLSKPQKRAASRRISIMLWTGIVWLGLNVAWSTYLTFYPHKLCATRGPELINSPARSVVSYERVTTNSTVYNTNQFRGTPSPNVTAAWHNAYTKWARIVVSEEDMKAIGRQSIPMSDGSGYLATLDVFHQLHCLVAIREYIFKDYYRSEEEDTRRWEHVDHCIDTIRLALMCQGDIAVVPFLWQDDEALPAAQFHTVHECRKWDSILGWAKDRQADMSLVVRPK